MSTLSALIRAIEAQPGYAPGIDPTDIVAQLDQATIEALLAGILADEERAKFNRFYDLFPDETHDVAGTIIHARQLYPKHMEFFAAGATFKERCFMAGNRVGKTVAGGFESSCHLTGIYPEWWPGKKFYRPVKWWVAGDTNETTRDVLQLELLGEIAYRDNRKVVDGSGLVPRETLGDPIWKQGVQNLVDTIPIRHISGGWSALGFKSFDQGRRAFQGTAKHGVWLDEECPMDVYGECLVRTATTRGIIMTTFTPLLGLSELVLSFLPADWSPQA